MVLQNRKQENIRQEAGAKEHGYATCQMCGREIKPDTCSWQEDEEGAMYCRDCRAERESCGCSD